MAGPVETKVQASTGAAAASGLILWILGAYVFRGGVPDVIVSWVYVLVPGILAFAAGYLARHTPRPAASPVPPEKPLIQPPAATELPPSVPELSAPPAVPE